MSSQQKEVILIIRFVGDFPTPYFWSARPECNRGRCTSIQLFPHIDFFFFSNLLSSFRMLFHLWLNLGNAVSPLIKCPLSLTSSG